MGKVSNMLVPDGDTDQQRKVKDPHVKNRKGRPKPRRIKSSGEVPKRKSKSK
jgi:hypothetical protein